MAELPPERATLFEEETDFKSAVSEALLQKMGKVANHINFRQYDQQEAMAAGQYGVVATALASFPLEFCKRYVAPVNIEVMGIVLHSGVVGASGSTVMDIHKITTNGATDSGTIFSVKPAIASTASDNRHGGFYYDPYTASTVTLGSTPTGFTLPTFTALPFPVDQGDALRFDLDSVMGGSPQGIAMTLFVRPR